MIIYHFLHQNHHWLVQSWRTPVHLSCTHTPSLQATVHTRWMITFNFTIRIIMLKLVMIMLKLMTMMDCRWFFEGKEATWVNQVERDHSH